MKRHAVMPLCSELYPDCASIFMYRDIITTAKSQYRLVHTFPMAWFAYTVCRISLYFNETLVESMGLCGKDYRQQLHDNLQPDILVSCVVTRTYLNLRKMGINVAGLRYEDLVRNPAESFRRVLEHCGLPTDLVEPGLRGMQLDSQRNSTLAKSNIGDLPEPELTPDSAIRINQMLRKNGLPLIGEEYLLDGTISDDTPKTTE